MRILIIEDYGYEALLLASLCEAGGRQVDIANSMKEAWEKIYCSKIYDLVFLDLALPDSSPVDSLSALMTMKTFARVVIVTGNDSPELKQRAMDLGAGDYLQKNDPAFGERVLQQLSVLAGK